MAISDRVACCSSSAASTSPPMRTTPRLSMSASAYSSGAHERIVLVPASTSRHHGLSGFLRFVSAATKDPKRRRCSCFAIANCGTAASLRDDQSRLASAQLAVRLAASPPEAIASLMALAAAAAFDASSWSPPDGCGLFSPSTSYDDDGANRRFHVLAIDPLSADDEDVGSLPRARRLNGCSLVRAPGTTCTRRNNVKNVPACPGACDELAQQAIAKAKSYCDAA